MRILTVIVAAGSGERAGGGMPKQYRAIGGETLVRRTLRACLDHLAIDAVICAINPDHRALYGRAVAGLDGARQKLLEPAAGGASRQMSVHAALEAAADALGADLPELCLVHDAARPFVSAALIDRAIAAAGRTGAAIPALGVTDTVTRVDGEGAVVETLPREALRVVQTPQAFAFPALLAAHRRAAAERRGGFTDDGQIADWAGLSVVAFEGDPMNVKITRPEDFAAAEQRLAAAAPLVSRAGTGFDVHAFGPGDHVWLGGVKVAHDRGVLAHSDGDVVLHALTDAVLGALCDGDIGTHFPPSDPEWRGASSDRFLAYAIDKVRARGGRIDHLDSTVLCEKPRIGPHREAIRQRIAEIAGIPVSRVSVKATTTEKLGFTGRGEGLAAQASATIRLPEDDA